MCGNELGVVGLSDPGAGVARRKMSLVLSEVDVRTVRHAPNAEKTNFEDFLFGKETDHVLPKAR